MRAVPWFRLIKRLSGTWGLSARFGKDKNLLPLQEKRRKERWDGKTRRKTKAAAG
jgi:hypothetical protein